MKRSNGFSLIEVVVAIGMLSLLFTSAFFIGFPEYDRYVISSERDYLVDTILESRARSLVDGSIFVVSTWSNGYCVKDVADLCVVPVHNLPTGMTLTSISLATSTKIILENSFQTEINIDQYGYVDGQ